MNLDEIMEKQAQTVARENGAVIPAPGSGEENDADKATAEGVPASTPEPSNTDQPADEPNPAETAADSEPAADQKQQANTIDYAKFLEESSGGLFKSVEEFTASLDKIKEYDEIKQKLTEIESRDPFANDYVKKLNALVAAGKTQEQIDAFTALSRLGDLASMDPFEVKVQRLIFDGYPRATAERQVRNKFGLNISVDEDLLSEEELAENKIKLEDAQVALRISSKEDVEYLQSQLAKIEGDEDKQSRLLAEAAARESYEKKLTPFVNQLASNYEKGINIPVKVGDNDIEYKVDFDEDFRMDVAKMAKEFFLDNEVNEENIQSFKDFASAQYVAKRLTTDILPNAIKHGYALGVKAATDDLQNKSGLKSTSEAPAPTNPDAAIREGQRRAAFGED